MPSSEASLIGGSINPAATGMQAVFQDLKSKYDYVKKIDKNFQRLRDAEDFLHAKKLNLLEIMERNEVHMEPNTESQTWLQKVCEIETEVEGLKVRYENLHKCFKGMWPFLKLLKLSRDMVKITEELNILKNQIDLNNAMIEKKPEPVETKHPDTEDDIPLSLSQHVEKLLKFLRDEDVKRIGIWGMPGIGKSTLLKALNDKVYQMGMFDIVIWVEVLEEDSVRKIQLDILARLKQTVQDINSRENVAATISRALEKLNYLLLLDQVPMEINLDDVGVRGRHKCGKIVIASRHKLDCKRMDIHRVIKVSKLSNDDAWKLFRKIVGDVADHPRIKPIAKQIVRELGGLPLAIKTVAATLINEPEFAWSGALWALQSPDESQLQHFKELFTAFKFSYNCLPDDRKKCLLYGALFPKDYEIDKDYLMECWRSEQFIADIQLVGGEDNAQKLRASRDRGHSILQDLTEASFFEWSSRGNFLTMPVVFRMMALEFSYPQEDGSSLLVRAKQELNSPPEMEQWTDARRVSLICNELCALNDSPECPKITTLLLQRNKRLTTIPDSFFNHMNDLRVLDLSHTGIPSLPSSIINLVNLKALYLNGCQHLVTLSKDITKLENLEVLDIRDTGMESLPIEVAQLVSLRCLRVSFIYDPLKAEVNGNLHTGKEVHQQTGRIIPAHVIDNLRLLEELTIMVDPTEQSWNQSVESVVEDIMNLRCLTTLYFYFPNINSLSTFINKSYSWNNMSTPWRSNSFRSFLIIIGSNMKHHNYSLDSSRGPAERHLRFSADEGIFSEEIRRVLKQASAFELIGNQKIQSLSDISLDCMESLEVCVIESCHQLSSIISPDLATSRNAFPFLEKLHLLNLQNLCYTWDGSAGPKSFSNLTTLTFEDCNKLSKVFTVAVVKKLEKLQHLRIGNCSRIEEVIEAQVPSNEEDATSLSGALPNLEILELVDLPCLASICKDDSLDWHSLHKMEIKSCPALKNLSKGMYIAKHLTKIECTENWWRHLEFPDNEAKVSLQRRCYFIPEEPLSVYYTPPDDASTNYQPPDLRNLPNYLEENKRRHESASSSETSAKMSVSGLSTDLLTFQSPPSNSG